MGQKVKRMNTGISLESSDDFIRLTSSVLSLGVDERSRRFDDCEIEDLRAVRSSDSLVFIKP